MNSKKKRWMPWRITFTAMAVAVSLGDFTPAAAAYFSDRTVELENTNGEQWEFKVRFGESVDRIYYTYTSSGGEITASTVQTNLYSDTAPTAVLSNNSPILAWSSMADVDGDSDIYFAAWTGSGWSTPRMVHADNTLADMSPELAWSSAGTLTLSWWRNTGSDIVRIRAVYSQGTWEVENDVTASVSRESSTKSTSSYYSSITARAIDEPFKCIAIGDSITAGCKRYADTTWCSNDRTGETTGGYVDTLQDLLQSANSSSKVYNYGHPGERSYEGVARINSVMNAHSDANCILIMFGANDRYEELSTTDTRANIKLMADRAIAKGIAPIITTITPNTAVWGIEPYNDQIEDLANDYGIIMADQYAVLWAGGESLWESTYTSGDNLHVSAAGDVVMGNEWYETMQTSELFFSDFALTPIYMLLLNDD